MNQNQNQNNYRNNTKLGNDFTGIQNNYINPAENINNGANQKQNFHKIDMNKVIDSMNLVERNKEPENTINDEYTKYRFNPVNTVAPIYTDDKNKYTPFQDNIEKKFLQDKIIELENDFRKYKLLLNSRNNNNNNNSEDYIENFENKNNSLSDDTNKNDLLDLIVIIIIGLIIIFVLDSIFKIGKSIGARN